MKPGRCFVTCRFARWEHFTDYLAFSSVDTVAIIEASARDYIGCRRAEDFAIEVKTHGSLEIVAGMDNTFVGRRIAQQPSADDFAVILQTLFDGKPSPPHCLQKIIGHSQNRPPHWQT